MGKPKSKAAAIENGSEKRATKKTSKAAENLEAEATRTSKRQGAGLKSGARKSRSRAVETDGTLLEKEFEEAGTIRVPTEPDPGESDDEKEKETLVEKSGTLDNTTVVIGPNVKYLKSVDPSHVKEFVSACRSLRASGYKNSAKSLIEPALLRSITQKVQVLEGEEAAKAWRNWTNAKVLQFLERAYPASANRQDTLEQKIKSQINFKQYRPDSVFITDKINQLLNELIDLHPEVLDSIEKQRAVCKQLLQNAKAQKPPLHEDLVAGGEPKTLEGFSLIYKVWRRRMPKRTPD